MTPIEQQYDAVVVGAGFSGLYMLHRLREAGFSARVYEAAGDVGGVWYWNRYPGAMCDIDSICYCYTFSEELYKGWNWSSRYPVQREIMSYLKYVTDELDLRKDIQFNTRVTAAHYDDVNNNWRIQTDDGVSVSAKFFIAGVGNLSVANVPNIKGLTRFQGEWYHTGNWPHEKVDFKDKRVGVIGNGSSGVQAIPVIAKEAGQLFVFQRTPQYTTPAANHPLDPEYIRQVKENFHEIRRRMVESTAGSLTPRPTHKVQEVTPEERDRIYEEFWQSGVFLTSTFTDLLTNEAANETVSEFIRSKIRNIVKDPRVAEMLIPTYPYGTKRPIKDTGYYETFNRENVFLVDLGKNPIEEITAKGVQTAETEYELDMLVFATGYDAMTGPFTKIDIRGRDGFSLKEKWVDGVRTYLGITNSGFPNFFMITGPESPTVVANLPFAIEQHVDWIMNCIEYLRKNHLDMIEAQVEAEEAWSKHCRELADATLYTKTDSWYTGANIEGKPRGFLIYLGGIQTYQKRIDEVASGGYQGFTFR